MAYATNVTSSSRVSWGAIIAGTVVALIVQLSLSVLGAGIGLSTVNPQTGGTPDATTLSTSAGIWLLVSSIVASLIGGFIAGRFVDGLATARGGYHGLVSWATTTVVVLALLGTAAGGIIGGAFGAASSVLAGAGRAIGNAVQTAAPSLTGNNDILGDIERQVRSSTGGQDPAQLRDKAINAVRAALTGDRAQQEQSANEAAEALAQARGIPVDQARADISRYQQQYVRALADAKAKAAALAEASASAASKGALIAFLALVLGAAAGTFGGRYGAAMSRRDIALERQLTE